ncbi:MAG: N-acetylmuramoyl-L-alanine amidase [Maricaulaceae bacterium]
MFARAQPAPSPNWNARTEPIKLLVLHYTGMADGASALAKLRDPAPTAGRYAHAAPGLTDLPPETPIGRVSAHYLVQTDGEVLALVDEDKRAWHAGLGRWCGVNDLNSASIGVEIVNGGHAFDMPPYPDVQIEAVIALCREILERYELPAHAVVGHSDVDPTRKADPGEHFPWARLAAAGVGLWPVLNSPLSEPPEDIAEVQAVLSTLGYALETTGEANADTRAVLAAFQRRYRPAAITGALDPETWARIASLSALPTPD